VVGCLDYQMICGVLRSNKADRVVFLIFLLFRLLVVVVVFFFLPRLRWSLCFFMYRYPFSRRDYIYIIIFHLTFFLFRRRRRKISVLHIHILCTPAFEISSSLAYTIYNARLFF
jgi:hypothetical protein